MTKISSLDIEIKNMIKDFEIIKNKKNDNYYVKSIILKNPITNKNVWSNNIFYIAPNGQTDPISVKLNDQTKKDTVINYEVTFGNVQLTVVYDENDIIEIRQFMLERGDVVNVKLHRKHNFTNRSDKDKAVVRMSFPGGLRITIPANDISAAVYNNRLIDTKQTEEQEQEKEQEQQKQKEPVTEHVDFINTEPIPI